MPRFIALLIIGFGAFFNGFCRFGTAATSAERSGWIYQHFGANGIAIGLMLLGSVLSGFGISMGRKWVAGARAGRIHRK